MTDPGRLGAPRVAAGERLDVLVNNAGIIHVNPLLEETLDDWNRLLAVNATGDAARHAGRDPGDARRAAAARSSTSPRIFGVAGSEGYIAYYGQQGGDHRDDEDRRARARRRPASASTRSAPAASRTPMNENEPEGGVVPLTPLGRRADVSEISRRRRLPGERRLEFVTGTEIVVDGGYLAR